MYVDCVHCVERSRIVLRDRRVYKTVWHPESVSSNTTNMYKQHTNTHTHGHSARARALGTRHRAPYCFVWPVYAVRISKQSSLSVCYCLCVCLCVSHDAFVNVACLLASPHRRPLCACVTQLTHFVARCYVMLCCGRKTNRKHDDHGRTSARASDRSALT